MLKRFDSAQSYNMRSTEGDEAYIDLGATSFSLSRLLAKNSLVFLLSPTYISVIITVQISHSACKNLACSFVPRCTTISNMNNEAASN